MLFLKRLFIGLIILVAIATLAVFIYLRQPQFGAISKGDRLKRIEKSSNFRDGKFRNYVDKPSISEGYSLVNEAWKSLTGSNPDTEPKNPIPSIRTDIKSIPIDSNVLIWFGHSSFYMQIDSVRILVDPVFSGNASPIPGAVIAYPGTDVYSVEDLPDIDYMLLSHDHYDHVDYKTALELQPKVRYVICGLGVGAHYERWGYKSNQILEKDWTEKTEVKPGFIIYAENTHHASGRTFSIDKSLWLSFYIDAPSMNIYYSGDGGYSDRFVGLAEKYPPITWAIMECGQYNKAWQSVHELPEEVAKATNELKAKSMIPVHNSKFTLARHPWYEPLEEITKYSEGQAYRLVTPILGEVVNLNSDQQVFSQWWKSVMVDQ